MSDGRRPAARGRRRIPWPAVTAIVAVLAVSVGLIVFALTRSDESDDVVTYEITNRNHVEGTVPYPQTPPVGGPHNNTWQTCGIYTAPVRNEYAVHSLEHGAVWITYRPDLPQDQINRLTALAQGRPNVLLSPYPGLPAPVVASAWGKQLRLGSVDETRLRDFLRKYVKGPQTPEPDATCAGGVNTPAT